MKRLCVYPGCMENATVDAHGFHEVPVSEILWCDRHFGLYPHDCEEPGCDARPVYDDEPKCFKHSPDIGSSQFGYSAYKKANGLQ